MFETFMNTVIDLGKEVVRDYVEDKVDEFINYRTDGTDLGDCLEDITDSVKTICSLFK